MQQQSLPVLASLPAVAALHAGAAIHCWPAPQAALAEISRVLRPGGLFVASTFLNMTAPLGQLVGNDDLVAPLSQVSCRCFGARDAAPAQRCHAALPFSWRPACSPPRSLPTRRFDCTA